MLRRAQDIIGLPVIEVATGQRLATVEDFLLDEEWNLQGILLDSKHWFSSPRYIRWEDLISIGQDAVTISDEKAILQYDNDLFLHSLLTGNEKITGLPVMTVSGHQLGILEDVYFLQNMGKKIKGFELSDGFISDLQEGRKWLPIPLTITLGKDTILVPVYCEHNLEETLHQLKR